MRQPSSAIRRYLIVFATAFAVTALTGACEVIRQAPEEAPEGPPEQLYNTGMDLLLGGNPVAAAAVFDEVDRQHPYSVWANKAQIMAAYALYKRNRYDDAIVALERFIQLHPGSPDAPYAYYLKALSYYERITDVGRDQDITRRAMAALDEVVRRYPKSKYARDARLKRDLTNDHLAGSEMGIGRFYLKKKQYLAAINRFRRVVDIYQTTSHVPEALHRLTEAYLSLGLKDEAQATTAVLGHNFPGSDWYVDSYALITGTRTATKKEERSWIGRAWNSVF
ncbi:MAG: outer membrane protein assembly factor BamD [Proteobacteria bacterium]|nr:outer membrane protein assembly factor BamD [Pseudomonadota bacterium]